MKKQLGQWKDKFDALTLRERAIVTLTFLLGLYMVWDNTIFRQVENKRNKTLSEISQWNKQIKGIDQHILKVSNEINGVTDPISQARIQNLKFQINSLQENIDQVLVDFIRPSQMVVVLKQLLEQDSNLKLMKLNSMAPKSLFDPRMGDALDEVDAEKHKQVAKMLDMHRQQILDDSEKKFGLDESSGKTKVEQFGLGSTKIPAVYRHGMEIEFLGTYVGTLNYLRAVESLPWHFYWELVSYDVVKHPQARIIIKIYTLSLDKEWIGV